LEDDSRALQRSTVDQRLATANELGELSDCPQFEGLRLSFNWKKRWKMVSG
jgi:hypothetical protein